ncbi:MAG TPA: patatin-like phospholipase family protein [Gemmatimonadaceae bacterium]|nr:patatin-like phospholipase family protein [Gemmatimonadaceae bacterium]
MAQQITSRPDVPAQTALVLGGGGLKGFAHIGVLRALEERGVRPSVIAGTSIGALIGAAYALGTPVEEMAARARALRRRDLFRINHMGMLLERMRSPSLYLEARLRELCASVIPADATFRDVTIPLLVNTVDIESGTQVVWGLPGLDDVSVLDAVYASCALPGAFPPGYVHGRVCVDGGVVDNLPAAIASVGQRAVIAVDVGSSDLTPVEDITVEGFASIYMRAATVMMHTLQLQPLAAWKGPPLLLVRPRVAQMGWFNFDRAGEVIEIGYRTACSALDGLGQSLTARGGVYPRRLLEVEVDEAKCIGCRTCVALAPRLMRMDASGKAYPVLSPIEWSPAEGHFVNQCPTQAITVRWLDGSGEATQDPEREPTAEAAGGAGD